MKLARLYTGKSKFISTINSFHGKTMGSLSVTGRDLFRKPFLPLLEAVFVRYGDAETIEKAIDDHTAAVILEPIQGEGGVAGFAGSETRKWANPTMFPRASPIRGPRNASQEFKRSGPSKQSIQAIERAM